MILANDLPPGMKFASTRVRRNGPAKFRWRDVFDGRANQDPGLGLLDLRRAQTHSFRVREDSSYPLQSVEIVQRQAPPVVTDAVIPLRPGIPDRQK